MNSAILTNSINDLVSTSQIYGKINHGPLMIRSGRYVTTICNIKLGGDRKRED